MIRTASRHLLLPILAAALALGLTAVPGSAAAPNGSTSDLRRSLADNVPYRAVAEVIQMIGGPDESFGLRLEDLHEAAPYFAATTRPSKAIRRHIGTTPIRDGRFTFTVLADQACVSQENEDADLKVVEGPCDEASAVRSARPLADLVGLVDATLGRAWQGSMSAAFFGHMSVATWVAAADPSIRVVRSSVTDRNYDHIDDDGRYELIRNGRTYCLQTQLSRGSKTRLLRSSCSELEPRSTTWLSSALYLHQVARVVTRDLRSASRLTRKKISRLGQHELTWVRDEVGNAVRVTRTAPLKFRVSNKSRHCWVDVTFAADRVAAKAELSKVRCNS